MIEIHGTFTSNSCILDTTCRTYICTDVHGLKGSRKSRHRELDLIMGNKQITYVDRIADYKLKLFDDLYMVLLYCFYLSEKAITSISF